MYMYCGITVVWTLKMNLGNRCWIYMPWLIETVRCGRGGEGVGGRGSSSLPLYRVKILVSWVLIVHVISLFSVSDRCHPQPKVILPFNMLGNCSMFVLHKVSVEGQWRHSPSQTFLYTPLPGERFLLAALEEKIPLSLANPYFAAERLPGTRCEPRYFQLLHPAAGTWVEPYQSLVLTRDLGQKLMWKTSSWSWSPILLTPISDQDIISPYSINTVSCRQAMGINNNISYWIIRRYNTKFSKLIS